MIETTDTTPVVLNVVDTTVTHVHVYDTTLHHVNVYDTVVTHVYDTVTPELITVYEKLISAQDDKFEFLLGAVGIIVTVLVVFVTVSNILISKKLIKHDFKKTFAKEKLKIDNSLKVLDKKYHLAKGESSRLFANTNDDNLHLNLAWWSECIKEYTLADRERGVKYSVEIFHEALKKALSDKNKYSNHYDDEGFNFDIIRKNVEYIPLIVPQREQILEQLTDLEEHIKQKPKVEEVEIVE
ncbi:hypothetical protein [Marinifilum fragile]|uniref:hypothetical protein n=1 Tax=Marinifilum fragile TaxID=570161 RepID=UPI002AA94399|nr:hypothetical protein [Marinifilum fragile]